MSVPETIAEGKTELQGTQALKEMQSAADNIRRGPERFSSKYKLRS
jgi:hypothetical protein